MTSTGTYTYSPSFGDLTLLAFARIGLRRPELVDEHFANASQEANLVQVEFTNRQPNLWEQTLYSVTLTQGTASYTLLPNFIAPMAVYLTVTPSGGSPAFDRILAPISTYEYAALPNKTLQAQPTTYWYQRLSTPVIFMWPVPDGTNTYTLNMQVLSQIQDASLPSGVTPNLPYRWLDAYCWALAARLSSIYKPELEMVRKADAERSWQLAAKEDIEYVPTYIYPGLFSYYS